MKTRSLGFFLMVIGACTYGAGCGSNNNGGTGGAAGHADGGTGGIGAGGMGTGGTGTGGHADAGADVHADVATDIATDVHADVATDIHADVVVDSPVDSPTDTGPVDAGGATFTQVYAIISNIATPTADTAPGCANCHDGIIPDGGTPALPHSMDFKTSKAIAYTQLVGINSLRCAGVDGGAAVKRVATSDAANSVLYQKLAQGLGMGTACDGVQMPLQRSVGPADGGSADGGPDGSAVDAGFIFTHFQITTTQLATIMSWINAGAMNN